MTPCILRQAQRRFGQLMPEMPALLRGIDGDGPQQGAIG